MYRPAPKIEERSPEEIFTLINRRLAECTARSPRDPDPPAEALTRIFARYWEILIDRLNRVPEKNFLAYLDSLGVSPVSPVPARVPLTFVPVVNGPASVRIPARTRVAAQAEEGETEPVVFETDRPLELTTAALKHVFSLDPVNDAETDLKEVADAIVSEGIAIFPGRRPSDHVLFVGHTQLLALPYLTRLRLKFEIEANLPVAFRLPALEWIALDSKAGLPLVPSADSTNGLTQSGEVVLENLPPCPEQELRGRRSRWLACRLVKGMRGAGFDFWRVHRIGMVAEVKRCDVPLELAFADVSPVNLTKDFFPFSPYPVFGSTLYLASSESLSHPGASVALDVKLTNPHDGSEEAPIPTVNIDGHPRVWWEYWNGTRWARLSESDQTKGFRVDGVVSFLIPDDFSPTTVNGVENSWIRVRLISGNYGEPERWVPIDPEQPAAGLRRHAPTLAPPSIKSLTASYEFRIASNSPEATITSNQRLCDDVTERIRSGQGSMLFGHPGGSRPALYLGFEALDREKFVNRSVTLYLKVEDQSNRPVSRSGTKLEASAIEWQFWDGSDWRNLSISDESSSLTFSGLAAFVVPEQIVSRTDLTESCWLSPAKSEPQSQKLQPASPLYWFRIVSQRGMFEGLPHLRGILRNTTLATHTLTLENEVLGSSDGTPHQRFYATRSPILMDVELQVREAELASEVEQILREMPEDRVEIRRDESMRVQEVWVRWDEVRDFVGSAEGNRHYVVARQSGEVQFGDGRHGRIPPRGSNNIRLRRYQTGGGARGNKSHDKINQLRAAIPYVESVTNLVEALGGFDLEDLDLVRERGATTVRHRSRAVTVEDYEDLAKLASPEVARAKCIPLRDLAADPDARCVEPGVVSLLIVPKSNERKPLPSATLLRTVRSYLDRYRELTAELVVTGPDYVQISVEADLVVAAVEEAGRIAEDVKARLRQFLHPLFGGSTGQGWRFSERPHRSDFYGLCASVAGVDHIRSMRVVTSEDRSGSLEAGNFLIYSGEHTIKLHYASVREQLSA